MPDKSSEIKAGVHFVRFYGNDWFTGTIGMKADERGVYISICVYIWTTGRRVPLDDAEAARMMGLQFNNYQRLRDRLVVKGKVQKHENGYGVARAEKELDIARDRAAPSNAGGNGRRPEPAPESSNTTGAAQADCNGSTAYESAEAGHTILGAPIGAPAGAPTGKVEKSEEILRANKELDTVLKKETPKPPQGTSGEVVQFAKPVLDWRTAFGNADDHDGIEVVNGALVLSGGTRGHWLAEFDGDERSLTNALKEAHAAVNIGSRKSLKVQVEAKLANIVRDTRSRRSNALAIAAAKNTPKPLRASRW